MSDRDLSGSELRRRMAELDPESRRRISRAVRRGERLESRREAALGAALARTNLKTIRVLVVVLVVLAALKAVQLASAVAAGRGILLDAIILGAAAAAGVKFLAVDRPRLLRAERLNRGS
ncbi:MAG TPA: hypothetical protein VHL78_09490 [Actinomycetota bacterium]|nr:hypothetical protein [Actinomycetota bacterium]